MKQKLDNKGGGIIIKATPDPTIMTQMLVPEPLYGNNGRGMEGLKHLEYFAVLHITTEKE